MKYLRLHWTLALLLLLIAPSLSQAQWITHGPAIGAVGPDSACVYIRSTFAMPYVLEYSTDSTFATGVQTINTATRPNLDNTMIVLLQGLTPATRYYIRFRFGGQLDQVKGSFRTFPAPGQVGHYVLTAGSCQETADMDVFLEIPRHNPDIFLHLGDWTYPAYQLPNNYPEDWTMVEESWRRRYAEINMREMLYDMPIDYVYDDDDFTEGGSTRNYYTDIIDSAALFVTYHRIVETYVPDSVRANVIRGYYQFFPHYGLVDTTEGVFHKFTLGNVEVFFLDTRATATPLSSTLYRDPQSALYSFAPTPDNTVLRQIQMDWLLSGLQSSTADWKVICIGNVFNQSEKRYIDFGLNSQLINVPGLGSGFSLATAFSNNWSGFPEDSHRLLHFIDSLGLKDIFVLSGQSHNNVVDDGTNAGLPELNASGLSVADRSLSQQMQALTLLGLPPLTDSLWNGGGNGLNGASLENGFGKVEVFGRDSCRLSAVDKTGEVMGSVLLLHSSLGTGLQQADADGPEFTVFPNPTDDLLRIRLDQPGKPASYFIVNSVGGVVRTGRLPDGQVAISTEQMPAGSYRVVVTQGTAQSAQQVVVRH